MPMPEPEAAPRRGTSRRNFLGYLVAAPTLVAAVSLVDEHEAGAAIGSLPEPSDLMDLGDLQVLATLPTANMITVVVNADNTATFAVPRAEVGQGIETAVAMLIAEELSMPLANVHVAPADARPELQFNQLTGGSNSIRSLYTPVRKAAAIARQRLINVAAAQWGVSKSSVTAHNGVLTSGAHHATYGSFAAAAAVSTTQVTAPALKPASAFTVIGTPQSRQDAHAIVTGQKKFAMDLDVPNALPTMVCRPPTIKGTVKSVSNMAAVLGMPGVTHVGVISTGVAVRAKTFGQCIDAVRALNVVWGPGPDDAESDDTVLAKLHKTELPLLAPPINVLAKTIDRRFTFSFASNSPLETGAAVADVRSNSAEIWACLKVPIVAQNAIAAQLGLPLKAVKVHVAEGGGSFGRHLFHDTALEAAEASQKFGVPVKLMWHRTDDFRAGRVHPMATSRVRAIYLGKNVLTFEQRHTSVSTDFGHGFGDLLTSLVDKIPGANTLGFAQTIFELTANVPYNFGITDQALSEFGEHSYSTGSMRNIYSPDVSTALELVVDELADAMGMNPYAFRAAFLKNARSKAVLNKAASVGNWGRAMAPGTAQGIAFHEEYKGVCACLVEIDCRPATVNRQVRDAWTGPRVTKAVFVVDVGLAINPRGLEAQMMGGVMDGIALALTSSLHLKNGQFLEGSWDNYFYTRQWNVPPDLKIVIMPTTTGKPGGAGEFGVAAAKAATACAYRRATGTMPTTFPINHNAANLGFDPLPTVPPIPQSPTDGLTSYFS